MDLLCQDSETPTLSQTPMAGGAAAIPFQTRHNGLAIQMVGTRSRVLT